MHFQPNCYPANHDKLEGMVSELSTVVLMIEREQQFMNTRMMAHAQSKSYKFLYVNYT